MFIYSIITTSLLILSVLYFCFHNKKTKLTKNIESLFFEDFFDLVPTFYKEDFNTFIKKNTFIVCIQNDRYDTRFKQIPSEREFLKIFKSFFPDDVSIQYKNQHQRHHGLTLHSQYSSHYPHYARLIIWGEVEGNNFFAIW